MLYERRGRYEPSLLFAVTLRLFKACGVRKQLARSWAAERINRNMLKMIRYAALAAALITGPATLGFAQGGGGGAGGGVLVAPVAARQEVREQVLQEPVRWEAARVPE